MFVHWRQHVRSAPVLVLFKYAFGGFQEGRRDEFFGTRANAPPRPPHAHRYTATLEEDTPAAHVCGRRGSDGAYDCAVLHVGPLVVDKRPRGCFRWGCRAPRRGLCKPRAAHVLVRRVHYGRAIAVRQHHHAMHKARLGRRGAHAECAERALQIVVAPLRVWQPVRQTLALRARQVVHLPVGFAGVLGGLELDHDEVAGPHAHRVYPCANAPHGHGHLGCNEPYAGSAERAHHLVQPFVPPVGGR
jgi:hypothetical protein